MSKDYYKILDVDKSATAEDVKKAFKKKPAIRKIFIIIGVKLKRAKKTKKVTFFKKSFPAVFL